MTHLEKYAFVKNSSGLLNVFRASKFMGALPKLVPKVTKAVKNWAGDMRSIVHQKRNLNQIAKIDKTFVPDMNAFQKFYMNTPGQRTPAAYKQWGGLMTRADAIPEHLMKGMHTPTNYAWNTPMLNQLWHSTANRLPMSHNYLLGAQSKVQGLTSFAKDFKKYAPGVVRDTLDDMAVKGRRFGIRSHGSVPRTWSGRMVDGKKTSPLSTVEKWGIGTGAGGLISQPLWMPRAQDALGVKPQRPSVPVGFSRKLPSWFK